MRYLGKTEPFPTWAVYDIEATDFVDPLCLCHVDGYGNKATFSRADGDPIIAYVEWLLKTFQQDETVIWAHFGGKYDHRFLIPVFDAIGADAYMAWSGFGPVLYTATLPDGRVFKMCDSYRLMNVSLGKLGDSMGYPKDPIDRTRIGSYPVKMIEDYCMRDCEILMKSLQNWQDKLSPVGFDFAITAPSTAARWVRRNSGINFDRLGPPEERKWDTWCEPAYHGGRTEMFRRGEFRATEDKPIHYYDVRSMYPWAMRKPLPLYFTGMHAPPAPGARNTRRFLKHAGITEARVKMPPLHVPPLAIPYQGRLVFPVGEFTGRWTNIELMAALDAGAELELGMQARFEAVPFLREFVSQVYDWRVEAKTNGDKAGDLFFKLMMNSCYGKLGEMPVKTSYVRGLLEAAKLMDAGAELYGTPMPGWFRAETGDMHGAMRHIAAGAYVTAHARLQLYKGLRFAAEQDPAALLYCDTDSVVSLRPFSGDSVTVGGNLGDWEEESRFVEMEILAPKVYRAVTAEGEVTHRCKGIPMNREGDPDESLAELRWQAYKQARHTTDPEALAKHLDVLRREGVKGFASSLRDGHLDPRVIEITRTQKSEDQKRLWTGQESKPLVLTGFNSLKRRSA